eukprot:756370-Hanusia_phi.AAC.10
MQADGSHVRWGEVEKILREAGYHDISRRGISVQEAGDLLAHDDIIFRANVCQNEICLQRPDQLISAVVFDDSVIVTKKGVDGSILEAELKKTNEALAHLRARNIRGFASARAVSWAEKSWSQRGLGERRSRRSLPNVTEPYPGGASPAAVVPYVPLPVLCSADVIACLQQSRQVRDLPVNGDGLISLSEYEAEYSIERQKYDDGFKAVSSKRRKQKRGGGRRCGRSVRGTRGARRRWR